MDERQGFLLGKYLILINMWEKYKQDLFQVNIRLRVLSSSVWFYLKSMVLNPVVKTSVSVSLCFSLERLAK